MSDHGPEQTIDDGVTNARPACVALVPVAQRTEWAETSHQQPSRPASTFIAQLLATAEPAQQARGTAVTDAQIAYSASRHQARGAGMRTRQII